MRVSPCRRSRICGHQTFSVFRLPIRFLAPFVTGCTPQRAFTSSYATGLVRCRRFKDAAAGDHFHHWKPGFNQCRLSLSHAHKTCGTSRYIPSRLAAFPTCSFPPCLSTQGRLGVLRGSSLSASCPCGAIQWTPKRRK